MPDKSTIKKAQKDKAAGKSASTQAGEFVRKEIDDIRAGKHGARNTKQAIAIGLNEARRAGVDLKAPAKGKTSEKTRKAATSASAKGKAHEPIDKKRSAASKKALQKEGTAAASPSALSRQAKSAAKERSASSRSASAKKAAKTRAKGK